MIQASAILIVEPFPWQMLLLFYVFVFSRQHRLLKLHAE